MPTFLTDHHEVCKECALGKYVRAAFPKSDHRSKGALDLIHSDICGPMSSLSIGGKFKYYISFIDDFSRKMWIYFLTSKESGEVLRKFQEFKALVENQIGRRIKVLRTNNGGEYTSHAFKKFCTKLGLRGS